MSRKDKTVEEIYRKMTQLEHVIARPDTYVGSVQMQSEKMWVWSEETEMMVNRQINFVPGLYKIFDEILVNASDNKIRDPKGMDQLKVDIDVESCCIKILNTGRGLPIEIHKEHKIYIPEMVFGHLLTSDNYNDNEKKVTGGRNGYGAKLANIFSNKFVVSTADSSRGLKYRQVFEKNMSSVRDPKIDKYSGDDYTEVTFYPDMSKFGMSGLDSDIVSLMHKRVYDIAGAIGSSCKIYLNGKRLNVKGFKDYCELYLKGFGLENPVPRVHEKIGDRWEIVISLSDPKEGCGQFQQVSFVNSICTTKGGTHVNHVVDKFVPKLLEKVESKNRGGMKPQPFHIKNHMWVFINCLIENPSFDSQTKETLTTKPGQFGSECAVTDGCVGKVLKLGIVEQVVNWIKSKQDQNINKLVKSGGGNVSRILGIPKLEDANDAGTRNGDKCTLILTEGDSAKALAVAGLGVVGRDRFGVFPLRGKLLNVRDATYSQTVENKEVQALMKIVGIDPSKQYDSAKNLRYGSVMLMTDQDHDGSHIKGLLINMMHHWWPSLCKMGGFLKEFVTPIVKVTPPGGGPVLEFFTMTEYEAWKSRDGNEAKGWKTKYYKGLGTSTAKEAREYFSNVEKHRIAFKWQNDNDGECIDMAFNKKRADDRKEWINGYEDGVCVDHRVKTLSYSDFINKELVQFSKYDVMRSIPSVVDGLKPGQRKVLFCAFKRNLKSDIKVAQFIGYVSEQSAYHHGEQSLESTIVGMAQDFVGSNNLNLLYPSGQFGTRLQGGKDAASGRYIYTRLCGITRKIFSLHDDALLATQTEEGQKIEPKWYCPVIPMVLVNGAEGIGTGWSTNVPCFSIRDIIDNLRNLLRGRGLRDMVPAYRGFTGGVDPNGKGGFEFTGRISVLPDGRIEISELPVKTWTQNYKEFLQEMLVDFVKEDVKKGAKVKGAKQVKPKAKAVPKKRKKPDDENESGGEDTRRPNTPEHVTGVQIKDFKEYHTEHTVCFRIEISADMLLKAENLGLEKVFKLKSTMGTSNMVLFDPHGKIRRYESALEIIEEFAALRIEYYVKRKNYLISKLAREIEICENRKKFVKMVVCGALKFENKPVGKLIEELRAGGIRSMQEIEDLFKIAATDVNVDIIADAEGVEEAFRSVKAGFDYLLGMTLWNLTAEKVAQLEAELESKLASLFELKATSPEQMWDTDLVDVLTSLDQRDSEDAAEVSAVKKAAAAHAHKMDGEITTVDIKPLEPKPQVWRKREEIAEKKELEHVGKSLNVTSEGGSLLERLLKKQRLSDGPAPPAPTGGMMDFLVPIPPEKSRAKAPPRAKASPPKKIQKIAKKQKYSDDELDDESEDDELDDDEESSVVDSVSESSYDEKPRGRKTATRKPIAKKSRPISDSESVLSSSSSSAVVKSARKRTKVVESSSDDDSDDSDGESDDDSDY